MHQGGRGRDPAKIEIPICAGVHVLKNLKYSLLAAFLLSYLREAQSNSLPLPVG
jgi:hypothetical protein